MPYKFAQLILSPTAKAKSFSDIFIAEVDVEKEMRLGKLFILVEIDSNRNDSLKMINYLLTEIPKNYYQNEKYIFKETALLKTDYLLEAALTETNKTFTKFCSEQRIPIIRKNINLTVGVIHKDFLYFSVTGKNKAFLIARIKEKDAIANKMINILDDSKGSEPETESKKYLFSHIISGPIPRGAYALFTNEALPEYFSDKKLSEIITTLPPAGAVEQIKNDLSNIGTFSSILGLLIKNLKTDKNAPQSLLVAPPTDPSASLSYLDKTEKQTETFLSPSGMIPVKKWSGKLVEIVKSKSKKYLPANQKFILIGEKIILKKRVSRFSPKKILTGVSEIAQRMIGFAWHHLTRLNFSRQGLKNLFTGIYGGIVGAGRAFGNWLIRLRPVHKILLGVIIICAVLFAWNLRSTFQNKKTAQSKQSFAELTDTITQKQNQIEASFLYGNDKGAKELILEVQGLLAAFPQDTGAQKSKYAELKKKFDDEEEKASHVVKVDVKELANFSLSYPNANPNSLIAANGKIFAYNPVNNSLYKVDLSGKAATILNLPADYQNLTSPALDKSGVCLYKAGNTIAAFNPDTEGWEGRKIDSAALGNLTNFASYNGRLYFIDKNDGQIIRLKKTSDGYGESMNWLNTKTDLSTAASLDIDGDVYILSGNGEVKKFASGRAITFKLETLTRPIEAATIIKVSPAEGGFIYVLEPKNKRLIVFKKTGEYALQYQSDKFDNLKDFSIDEKNKKIYFLNNASIFEANMEIPSSK